MSKNQSLEVRLKALIHKYIDIKKAFMAITIAFIYIYVIGQEIITF